ncbi:MAG: class I SAM-dependent DNA methyltransferase [Planctomycetota bacterium]
MPSRNDLLERLTRDELLVLADRYFLPVADRRSRDAAIAALTTGKVPAHALLGDLPRDRLKELCRALDLDDSGREKALLIDRLVAESPSPARPSSGRGREAGTAAPATTSPGSAQSPQPSAKFLTQADLERHLWAAADILRGSIDSSDYKNFIFGLLFLKRLSDRFDEECVAVTGEGGNPEDPDEHEFFVPKRARWSEIQKHATNLGEVLNKAASAIEQEAHNGAALEGVLAGIDFNDERKLGDARQRDQILARLIQHFANLDLRNASLSEPDMLGRAYEYLIERFADDAGKKGGEFYTPRKVVQLIVELLEPTERMRICDPTVGSGGMLIECAHYVAGHNGNPKNLSLFGQEKNLGTWAICKMNMLLHGIKDARIEKGDTIREPKLVQDGALMVFDRVIANPPFSLDEWGREVAEHDPWGRFGYGIPPKTKGDLAFVQHMVAVLNKHGKLGVVMPHGVLFRGSSEGEIRKGFLKDDLIEAVIGLPTNLFYGTGIPAAVLVLNRSKPAARRGKVLFVEASREFREGSAQNYLRDEDVKKIVATVRAFADVERYARVVPIAEIEKNDGNLNITRYVETAEAREKVDVGAALKSLRDAEKARDEAKAAMDRFLRELGLS